MCDTTFPSPASAQWGLPPTNAVYTAPPPGNAAGFHASVTYAPNVGYTPHNAHHYNAQAHHQEMAAMRVEANLRRFTVPDVPVGFERIVLAEATQKETEVADSAACADLAATRIPVDAARRELDAFAERMRTVQKLHVKHANLRTAGFVLIVALPISIPLLISSQAYLQYAIEAVTAAVVQTRDALAKNRALVNCLAETGSRIVVGLDGDALSAMFASADLHILNVKVVVALDRPLTLPHATIPIPPNAAAAPPVAFAAQPIPLAAAFVPIPLAEVASVEEKIRGEGVCR